MICRHPIRKGSALAGCGQRVPDFQTSTSALQRRCLLENVCAAACTGDEIRARSPLKAHTLAAGTGCAVPYYKHRPIMQALKNVPLLFQQNLFSTRKGKWDLCQFIRHRHPLEPQLEVADVEKRALERGEERKKTGTGLVFDSILFFTCITKFTIST